MVMTVEERKAAKKASVAKYYAENKEKKRLYDIKYRAENRAKLNAQCKAYSATYNKENKEKRKASRDKWRAENKNKINAGASNRRAKMFGATIYMTKEDKAKIAELYTIAKDATKLFGYDWAVDHIVPLNKGGLHKLTNLQVVPAIWNSAKRDRNCDTYWD